METINISDFRANLLKYLERANSGEQISVTTNGRLIATISPPTEQKEHAKNELKELAKTAEVFNVINPIDESWDAL